MLWVKIRSWHAVRTHTRGGGVITQCGRYVGDMQNPPETVDTLPGGRSCESCLRIVARVADAPPDSAETGTVIE